MSNGLLQALPLQVSPAHPALQQWSLLLSPFCTLPFLELEGQLLEPWAQDSSRMEKPMPEPDAG